MAEARMHFGRWAARTYGVSAYLFGLALLFFASVLTQTHAAGAAGVVLPPGAALVLLAAPIFAGHRWAMLAAGAIVTVFAIMIGIEDPKAQWVCAMIVAVFAALTLTGLFSAGPRSEPIPGLAGIDRIHAALIYLYGAFVAFIGAQVHTYHLGAPRVAIWALPAGALYGALSLFVWRGHVWAMCTVFVLTLAQWLALASLDPTFWRDATFYVPPLVSAALTLACVFARRSS